jgi:glycosyltransferase involved in cell wall biosynthesis
MKISIAIPTYEMKGFGTEMLECSFYHIWGQTYKEYEIVISDQSIDDKIKDLCVSWSDRLPINYSRFEEKRGFAAANTNNAIKLCKGDFIKILYQDDYLYDRYALKKTVDSFEKDPVGSRYSWLISTYVHTKNRTEYFDTYVPFLHERIHLKNLIGFPSCLTIRNKDIIFFNEDLKWAFDCEYYKRLYLTFGMPILLKDITVVNFLWDGQLSNSFIDTDFQTKEKTLIAGWYGDTLREDEIR